MPFWVKTAFLGQEVHYYMVYIAYFNELNLQICDYAQKRRICRENCKYVLDENFHGHFCLRRKAAKFCHPAVSWWYFCDNPIGVTYTDILRWWYFCDDIGVEQSCAPRRSRALWWLPTFGGDTDKGSSQWHLCMIKIKIKKEVIYC